MYSLMGMVSGGAANFGPFCSQDISWGVSFFLERLITHLSWILDDVEELTAVLKVLVVLEAILEVVVEALWIRCFSFLVWAFLYCRNVFSLLLKIILCRFVKVGSSSFCCRDVLMLAISAWKWSSLILVHLFYCGWVNIQLSLLWPVISYFILFDLQGFWSYFIC